MYSNYDKNLETNVQNLSRKNPRKSSRWFCYEALFLFSDRNILVWPIVPFQSVTETIVQPDAISFFCWAHVLLGFKTPAT